MFRRRLAVAAALALTCATAVPALTAQAQARRAPSITMTTLTPHITVGTGAKFSYTTTGLATGSKIQLLRRLTDGTWKVVKDLLPPGSGKTVTAPAVGSPNKYTYRMRVVSGGEIVATVGHNHDIFAYGNIPMETLCPNTIGNRVCGRSFVFVNGTKIATYMALGTAVYPNFFASAHFVRTSCRSASLKFTTKTANVKSYLKLVQGTSSYVASTPPNTLGHLTVPSLTSAQLFFDGSVQSGSGSVYVDGTLSCWTATGTY
jgi:hypothetical protein